MNVSELYREIVKLVEDENITKTELVNLIKKLLDKNYENQPKQKVSLKETELHSYSFSDGFTLLSKFEQVGDGKSMDWNGLRSFVEAHKDELLYIDAGMAEDWSATYNTVWDRGKGFIEDHHAWTSSRWATPAIQVFYMDNTDKVFELYVEGMDE